MHIHQAVLPEITTSQSQAKSELSGAPRSGVMQEQAAFTPLTQKEGHASFSLQGLMNKLPSMPFAISMPDRSHLLSSGESRDMNMSGRTSRRYESNLELACNQHSGQTINMEQRDYLQTIKAQMPEMREKVESVEDGVCLGLTNLWLLGRHSGLDDSKVMGNLLGYDADNDEVTSKARAKTGFEKVYVVQDTFQSSARYDGQYLDRRFDGASAVVRRYDVSQRIANLARMSVVPVRGETPFVLLNRREALGDGLVREVLHEGREQLLSIQTDSHVMAIYSDGHNQHAFYDPENGMFSFQSKANFTSFMNQIGKILSYPSDILGRGDRDQLMIIELKIH
ncbi:YopT-type cysteine protease domain-containing protein [Brenneria rubrifaciens]|uniref:Peptidase C58 YopT-type domain-containing protein n=1 Tax=Brenneria rubrifaciens TaxID=55213 RepID=A0A4P8QWW8_9GAMM|nr:YopT-type cysteine protease domain-containing protein [Brenneria rubrifaciens]QCR09999.1 hypothetical protein EH207_16755 [Brenneria rubrifaciens]